MATHIPYSIGASHNADKDNHNQQQHLPDDFQYGAVVAHCEPRVRAAFARKVFALVSTQLAATAALSAAFMYIAPLREFVLATPSLMFLSFLASLGFLFAAQAYKEQHPTNLYLLGGFTLSMAWSVGVTCAIYAARGLGLVVLEALLITASVTTGLIVYTMRSDRDFSSLGAYLGSALWVLIFGGLICSFTGASAMHLALTLGGAVVFSLYIIYDTHMITQRMSPDEYIPASIALYLDIVNLFLHILRLLSENDR